MRVDFFVVPPTIRLIDRDGLVTVQDQHPAWLPCTASGIPAPTVQWFKDGREISGIGYQVLSNGTLRITSVGVNDSGVYECVVSNKAGTTETNVTVDVQCKLVKFRY